MRAAERTKASTTLRQLAAERGEMLWITPALCVGLLRDRCAGAEPEIQLLMCGLEFQVPQRMSEQRDLEARVIQEQQQTLMSQRGLSATDAAWVLDAWRGAVEAARQRLSPQATPQAEPSSAGAWSARVSPAATTGSQSYFQHPRHRWELWGSLAPNPSGATSVALSEDGALVAVGASDGAVRVWALNNGRVIDVLTGHQGPVGALAFGPGNVLASGAADQTVRLWSPQGGVCPVLRGHTGAISGLVFDPAGYVISWGLDGTLRCWDTRSGQETGRHQNLARSLAYDGGLLAEGLGFHDVTLHEPWAGKRLDRLHLADVSALRRTVKSPEVQPVAVSRAAGLVASGSRSDGAVLISDTGGKRVIACQPAHRAKIVSLTFDRAGRLLLSSSEDGAASVWRASDGVFLQHLPGLSALRSAVFRSDDRLIVTACGDEFVRLWSFVD